MTDETAEKWDDIEAADIRARPERYREETVWQLIANAIRKIMP